MNNGLENKLNLYYKEISNALVCTKKQKALFIGELKNEIMAYVESSPEADINDIRTVFGSPHDIADSFTVNILTDKRKSVSAVNILIIALAAALIIWAVFAIISFIDVHTEAHGYFTEEILNIYNVSGGGLV